MTAEENVLAGMHCRLKGSWIGAIVQSSWVRREEERARQRAAELLAYLGLRGRAGILARHLPYGDQRRLEIARALATRSEEHTSEPQSQSNLVCRLLLEKKNT